MELSSINAHTIHLALITIFLCIRTVCSQSASNSTGVPYIRGRFDCDCMCLFLHPTNNDAGHRWQIKFRFVEMYGDQGIQTPCKGPFPYTYSDYVRPNAYSQLILFLTAMNGQEIYQIENSRTYGLCRFGNDCSGWPVKLELQQV